MRSVVLVLCLLVLPPSLASARGDFYLRDGQRVVFLGDSITFAGGYITYLDGYLFTRFPDQKFTLLNLGLPSETASGLSEPKHPFPRPDVHERLDRALNKTKPDVLVVCYGMNDGIYYPFAEERFQKYQQGIRKLLDRAEKTSDKITLLTPPPFDPVPVRKKLLPATAREFNWMTPYAGYDEVLARYAHWVLTLRRKNLTVVSTHDPLNAHLKAQRKKQPKYILAGDGVHLNARGHWLMAQQILRAWNAPAEVERVVVDAPSGKVQQGKVRDFTVKDGMLSLHWTTRLPMPMDSRWGQQFVDGERIKERFNQHRLVVKGAKHPRYQLFEGKQKLGVVQAKELATGVDLLQFKDLSTNRRAAEVGKLVAQRQGLLGRAWLSAVGHKRPRTPKGLPLAKAQKRAQVLEKNIRKLVQPTAIHLRLVPQP